MRIGKWMLIDWQFYPSLSFSHNFSEDEDWDLRYAWICIGPLQTRWWKCRK